MNDPLKRNSLESWYAKLHPMGKDSPKKTFKHKQILNLSLFFRIWIAVAIIIIISGVVVFNQLFNYVRPTTQQVIEDTLVDTAKVLAVSLQPAVQSGDIYTNSYQKKLDAAFRAPNLPHNTHIYTNKLQLEALSKWYEQKTHSSFRVYVTDAKGVVIYDSLPVVKGEPVDSDYTNAEGKDYSRWHDVYRTLKGEYGARTTRKTSDEPTTSIMYVAQPIYSSNNYGNSSENNGSENHNSENNSSQNNSAKQLIGVVSVGKPTATILPYLDATRQRMLTASLIISLVSLITAGLVAWWIQQSMMMVTRYTKSLAQDTQKPYFYLGSELNELTDTIESMKHRLENKAYVTDYVHTLTHELKSPLTAIRASGELLEAADLEEEDRLMLSQTITEQSIKLQSLIDRLLLLAKIEQPSFKLTLVPIHPDKLIQQLINQYQMQRQHQQIDIVYHNELSRQQSHSQQTTLLGDEFWLTQALQNVMDNALYYAQSQVAITLTLNYLNSNKIPYIEISIFNDGELIPDYAIKKVFDRYFSLSHQVSTTPASATPASTIPVSTTPAQKNKPAKKGTGLGLTLVKQVIERHGGDINIENITPARPNCDQGINYNNVDNNNKNNNKIKKNNKNDDTNLNNMHPQLTHNHVKPALFKPEHVTHKHIISGVEVTIRLPLASP